MIITKFYGDVTLFRQSHLPTFFSEGHTVCQCKTIFSFAHYNLTLLNFFEMKVGHLVALPDAQTK